MEIIFSCGVCMILSIIIILTNQRCRFDPDKNIEVFSYWCPYEITLHNHLALKAIKRK